MYQRRIGAYIAADERRKNFVMSCRQPISEGRHIFFNMGQPRPLLFIFHCKAFFTTVIYRLGNQ